MFPRMTSKSITFAAVLGLLLLGIPIHGWFPVSVCSGENRYHRGDCGNEEVWNTDDIHYIDDVFNVSWNTTLRIRAGVRIFVDSSHGSGKLVVEGGGRLFIEGTPEEPVVITSNATSGTPGDYTGIVVENGGTAVIKHTHIRFATIGIESSSDSVTVSDCRINDTLDWGIRFTGDGAPIISNTTVNDTGDGGVFSGGMFISSASMVRGCDIYNSSNTGIYMSSGSPIITDTCISNTTGNGLRITGSANPTIVRCNILDTWSENVHVTGNSRHIIFANCTIENLTNPGGGDTIAIENTDPDHRIDMTLLNTTYLNDSFDVGDYGNLTVAWYVNAHVRDDNGTPIRSVEVSLFNSTGWLADRRYTDVNGMAELLRGVEFVYNGTGYTFDKYHTLRAVHDGCSEGTSNIWMDGFNHTAMVLFDLGSPEASAGDDRAVNQHTQLAFDGSGSRDNIGIHSFNWTFVDGGPVTLYGEKPVYTFHNAGNFTVRLNVTDAAGNWNTDAVNVTVYDTTDPVAAAGDDLWVNQGETPLFNASGSTDNVGIINYSWGFTDNFPVLLFGPSVEYVFFNAGSFNVTLTVTDERGNSDDDIFNVTVNDTTSPEAVAGKDRTCDQGDTVFFNASGSLDNVGVVNFSWTVDENPPVILGGMLAEHTFLNAGNFTVILRVTDGNGNSAADMLIVNVNDTERPVSDTGKNISADQGDNVVFNGTASRDNVGVVNYTWSFYDDGARTVFGPTPDHTFLRAGSYEVTLMVTDAAGNRDEDIMTVTVRDTEPPVAYAGEDRSVRVGARVVFDGDGSTDNTEISNYTWNFLYNGTERWLYGRSVAFSFLSNGTYNVSLLVIDPVGNSDHDNLTLIVTDDGGANGGDGGNGTGGTTGDRRSFLWLWVSILVVLVLGGCILFLYFDRRRRMREGRKIDESEISKITGGRIDFIILRKPGTKKFKKYELHRIQGVPGDVAGIFWDTARDSSWVIDRMISGSREMVASKFEYDIKRNLDKGYSLDYFGTGLIIRLLGNRFR